MKKQEYNQLKEATLENLKELCRKAKLEAAKIKLDIARGRTKNVHAYLSKRKEIAKIRTLISQKSLSLHSQVAMEVKK